MDSMSGKIKIYQEHEGCIGCGSCVVVCPKFWKMGDNNKAEIIGGKRNEKGDYGLDVKEIGCNKDACDVCPVQVIKIIEY